MLLKNCDMLSSEYKRFCEDIDLMKTANAAVGIVRNRDSRQIKYSCINCRL